jgi:hypothetical protein
MHRVAASTAPSGSCRGRPDCRPCRCRPFFARTVAVGLRPAQDRRAHWAFLGYADLCCLSNCCGRCRRSSLPTASDYRGVRSGPRSRLPAPARRASDAGNRRAPASPPRDLGPATARRRGSVDVLTGFLPAHTSPHPPPAATEPQTAPGRPPRPGAVSFLTDPHRSSRTDPLPAGAPTASARTNGSAGARPVRRRRRSAVGYPSDWPGDPIRARAIAGARIAIVGRQVMLRCNTDGAGRSIGET